MKTSLFRKSKFGRSRMAILVGAAVVVSASAGVLAASRIGSPNDANKPSFRGTLNPAAPSAVACWGRLIPCSDVIELAPTSTMDGVRVERLLVEEGDLIRSGEVVATLDLKRRRLLSLAEAEARVALAEARLAQVKAGSKTEDVKAQEANVRRLEADLRDARDQNERASNLLLKKAGTEEDAAIKRAKHQSAVAALEQGKAQLDGIKRVRQEDVAVYAAELRQYRAALETTRAEVADSELRATFSGRVLKIHTRPGKRIGDKGVMEIGDTTVMHAVAEVFEEDAPRVRPGHRATVSVPSLNLAMPGKVLRVGMKVGRKDVFNNDPVADVDSRVVETRIELSKSDSVLIAGLSNARVEVRIEVE